MRNLLRHTTTTKRRAIFSLLTVASITIGIVALLATPAVALSTSDQKTPLDCTPTDKLVNPCRPWLGGYSFDSGWMIADIEGRPGFSEGLEKKTGKQLDVVRSYMPYGKRSINKESKYFIDRPETFLFTNFKPSIPWREGDGRNAQVNSQIDQMADSIDANVPEGKKIMLSIDAEPEDDISELDPKTSNECPNQSLKAKTPSGNPAQYRAMWQNVRNRFDAKGTSQKVVWVMNYMGYERWDCLIKPMYPGDELVDWIAWDPYISQKSTWDQEMSRVYSLLEQLTDENHQFTSKPWALPEFGSWHTSQADTYKFYQDVKTSLETNKYPRIKLYSIFDASGGLSSKIERVGNTDKKDPQELYEYSQFTNSKAFTDPLDTHQLLPNNLTYFP